VPRIMRAWEHGAGRASSDRAAILDGERGQRVAAALLLGRHAIGARDDRVQRRRQNARQEQARQHAADSDRRDLETEIQTGQPGDADINLDEQGRFGNLKQNLTNQWKVQDR